MTKRQMETSSNTLYDGLDQYWKAAVDFVQPNLRDIDCLIAPAYLAELYPKHQFHSYSDPVPERCQWVLVHKGMLREAVAKGLIAACLILEPVFANEIFIVFAEYYRLKPLSADNVHYKSFIALLARELVFERPGGTEPGVPGSLDCGGTLPPLLAPGIVQSLHRKIIGREPDPAALEAHTRRLVQEGNLDGVLGELLGSNEFRKKWMPYLE